MDSITHIALGACIGELYGRKNFGKKGLVIGAIAQSLPDIDFVASFWLSPAEDLLAHRGFTHSITFVLLASLLLAAVLSRWKWVPPVSAKQMALFLGLEMSVHLFIDAFNAYGTAWFEPFSHFRVSFHTLFVVDPLFSIGLGVAAVVLFLTPTSFRYRKHWATIGITLSCLYLTYAIWNKVSIQSTIERSLQSHGVTYTRYFSTPTPGNVWLWYLVVEGNEGYYIAHRSVFDRSDTIGFEFFPQQRELLSPVSDQESLQHLIRFSEGYFVVRDFDNKLVFNDLRFGQMLGWEDPKAPFVFYYYLADDDNELLIQRGRFAGWTKQSLSQFVKRMFGTASDS